jgi:hypothetical protein
MLTDGPSSIGGRLSVGLGFDATWFWFDTVRIDRLSVEGDGHSVTLRNIPKNVLVVQDLGIPRFTAFIGQFEPVDRHSGENGELSIF